MFDALMQEEKLNRCNGCAIQHPSQREHSCLTMDNEEAWMYYRDGVVEKIEMTEGSAENYRKCVQYSWLLASQIVGSCT